MLKCRCVSFVFIDTVSGYIPKLYIESSSSGPSVQIIYTVYFVVPISRYFYVYCVLFHISCYRVYS